MLLFGLLIYLFCIKTVVVIYCNYTTIRFVHAHSSSVSRSNQFTGFYTVHALKWPHDHDYTLIFDLNITPIFTLHLSFYYFLSEQTNTDRSSSNAI